MIYECQVCQTGFETKKFVEACIICRSAAPSYKNFHRFVSITHGDMSAEVDIMLAPLVKLMWQVGIITSESCQKTADSTATISSPEDKWPTIYFHGLEHPTRFMEMVYEPSQEALDKAAGGLPICLDFDKWKVSVFPHWKGGHVDYMVAVSFPDFQIEHMMTQLSNYLK